jgi:hypothetical protein
VVAGADVNLKCRSGNSALTFAARHGDLDTLKVFIYLFIFSSKSERRVH